MRLLSGMLIPAMRTIKSDYPWRCLCLGLTQITNTTRRRLTILHLAQIFFTDGRTFIDDSLQANTLDNSAFRKIVRAYFHDYPVTGQKANIVYSHLAGNMAENFVAIIEADFEGSAGQHFPHFPFEANHLF